MNQTSCDNCGIVLDKDKLNFPEGIRNEDGVADEEKAMWSSSVYDFVPFVPCPVCKSKIEGDRK